MSITSPVTPAGKAIASRNAVRRGLYSDATVVTRDEAEDGSPGT